MGIPPAISGCMRFINYKKLLELLVLIYLTLPPQTNMPVKYMILESRTSTPSPSPEKHSLRMVPVTQGIIIKIYSKYLDAESLSTNPSNGITQQRFEQWLVEGN